MTESLDRRRFLGAAAVATMSAPALAGSTRTGPNDSIVVGIMGAGGRGGDHAKTYSAMPGVAVATICDVDANRAGSLAHSLKADGRKDAEAVGDFRRMLDDKSIDAIIVATCNHWHAPAAILACAAGKHVYVEKPCSATPQEGEWLVEAARKNKRVVQMGNQRRSWPKIIEAIEEVRKGTIGRPYFARCMYSNTRASIGTGRLVDVPKTLDWDLWQGPAPRRPFRDNIHPYNWHWFWHWGNGELGNNGVHTIDVARWGLGVDYPVRVTSSGGRYRYKDDQETPDTHVASFEFEDRKAITWEGVSCNEYRPGGNNSEVVFYGDDGSIAITDGGYAIHDPKGKTTKTVKGDGGDAIHVGNFLAAIRGEAKPNSEISDGHRSTLLCHLGNIAHRTGRSLRCDPKDGRIVGDGEATKLWSREYEKGWEPKV